MENSNVEFQKFNLNEGDVLVVKVDISNCNEEEALKKLSVIREDSVLKGLADNGKKILFTYTGLDLSVLRITDADKLLVYADLSAFDSDETKDTYMETLRTKVQGQLSNEVVIVPVDYTALKAAVQSPAGE